MVADGVRFRIGHTCCWCGLVFCFGGGDWTYGFWYSFHFSGGGGGDVPERAFSFEDAL